MKLLVTGGAGRLGRELSKMVIEDGNEVSVFDLPSVLERTPIPEGCEPAPGDITKYDEVSSACEGVDGVIHLAAILPPKSEESRSLTSSVNVEGTKNLMKSLRNQRDTPIIFASSISVYGITADSPPQLKEDSELRPHNLYSESKILSENVIQSSNVPYTILRISPISVADLVELPEIIPYRSDQRVEFIHALDAANALYSSFKEAKARGKVYNIAGGSSWQLHGSEYIKEYYGALGVDVEANFSETYTAVDWYDTSRSRFLDYQKISFNMLLEELKQVAERLGLI